MWRENALLGGNGGCLVQVIQDRGSTIAPVPNGPHNKRCTTHDITRSINAIKAGRASFEFGLYGAPTGHFQPVNTPKLWQIFGRETKRLDHKISGFNIIGTFNHFGGLATRCVRRAKAHLLPGSALTLNNEGTLGLRTLDEAAVVKFMPVSLLRDTVDGVWLTGLPDSIDVILVGQEYVTEGVRVAPTFEELSQ